MAVDRCICMKVPFTSALETAREHGCASVAALQAHSKLGTNCGLCIPYMQRALATGETDLPVLGELETEHWLRLSGLASEEPK